MKLYHSIFDYTPKTPSVLTIGTFDGTHIGHREILENIKRLAQQNNLKSTVLTFFPHPRMVVDSQNSIKLIQSINERINALKSIGINNTIVHPFNEAFSNTSAKDFIEKILIQQLKVKKLVIGYDHRFGKGREGDITLLKKYESKGFFDIIEIKAQDIDSIAVSSTKIRNAITKGNITLANTYLIERFKIEGTVVKGNEIGKTIGFPTANISVIPSYKIIPKDGVYFVKALVLDRYYYGMMNIGVKPTINDGIKTLEVHLLDFNKNIYDENITVYFIEWIRNEKTFTSIENLKKQLASDLKHVEERIKNDQIS